MKNKEILHSWKEISDYLDRDIRTCLRWKTDLGLPIHRIDESSPRSKVFAYKSEIDEWLREIANHDDIKKTFFFGKKRAIIGSISFFALLTTIFAFLYFTNRISISPSPENLSIAVLPFENLNSSEYDEYFSEGITNEIINKLTRLNKLKVIRQHSAFRNRNAAENAKQIGKELGVDYILKGKIKRDENKIRINVRLIRTKDEKNIWNDKYDGKLEDIFSFQDNICLKISEILNINTDQKLFLSSNYGNTHDYLAFDNYLKGKYILNRLHKDNNSPWKLYHEGKYYKGITTQKYNELAIDCFCLAIEIDSNFALSYIGLADCYSNYVNFNWDFDIKWLNKAEELLKKARTISADFPPEYYATLIKIYLVKETGFNENTKTLALELAQEGIKKYPDNPQLNSIVGSYYFIKFGEEGNETYFDKALEYKEKSFWLNPNRLNNFVYVELLMLKKEFYRAIAICNNIEKPDSSLISIFRLGEIYYYLGDLKESESIFQQFDNAPLHLKIDSMFYLAMIASQLGEKENSFKIIGEINLLSHEKFIVNDYLKLSSICMGLEMKEEGYQYLKSFFNSPIAKKMHFIFLRYIDIDKNFESLREEEEFQKIIKNKEGING